MTARFQSARPLLGRIAYFLAGQGFVQAVTLVVGILLVQVLPIHEYALYTIAGALLTVVAMGANFGTPHAIVSLGAARRDDPAYVGGLWLASRRLGRTLFLPAAAAAVALSAWMLDGLDWPLVTSVACVGLVLAVGYQQIDIIIGRAVLNMHHDAKGFFRVGLAEALIRLVLVAACLVWPFAIAALAANLLSAVAARAVTARRIAPLVDRTAPVHDEQRRALNAFVVPLAPNALYTLVQGQIAIFLLSGQGNAPAIAGVGALSRLGQVFLVIAMLNPFFVQPVFARIATYRSFLNNLLRLLGALALFAGLAMASALFFPHVWLFVLGENYAGLVRELPLTIATSLATFVGGALYSVVISRGGTRGQAISVVPCALGQLIFIAWHGLHVPWTVWDALMIAFIPAVVYLACQAVLLVHLLYRWPTARTSSAA